MTDHQVLLQKKIEKRIENYRKRYTNPTKATIRRWQNEAKQELNDKNQLTLPLIFRDQCKFKKGVFVNGCLNEGKHR